MSWFLRVHEGDIHIMDLGPMDAGEATDLERQILADVAACGAEGKVTVEVGELCADPVSCWREYLGELRQLMNAARVGSRR